MTGATLDLRLAPCVFLSICILSACDGDNTPRRGATADFTSGVAAGDVTAESAVLWTRAEGGDVVTADIATDASFGQARKVRGETSAERDYTVKLKVDDLDPATRYHYRFRAGDAVSGTGTFVTAPTEGAATGALRFVFSGDSDGSRLPDGTRRYGEFEVLRAAAAEDPAFFVYFGDTIYGDVEPRATNVDGYRAKYRDHRTIASLADILAQASTYNMWDDHEVENDFASTTVDAALFKAGLRAFLEYWPINETQGGPLYRSFRWGRDVELILLDGRSYRDAPATVECDQGGSPDPLPLAALPNAPEQLRAVRQFGGLPPELPAACFAALETNERTMLGDEQMQWLKMRLRSDATWKIIINPVPVQAMLFLPYDRWEGYAAERRELLEFIRNEGIDNVVFLATDLHANVFGPVRMDPFVDDEPIAYEAVAGPIATDPLQQDIEDAIGAAAAGLLDAFLLGVARVDCAQLDSYAYGLVELAPDGRTLTITAKGPAGNELCRAQFTAGD